MRKYRPLVLLALLCPFPAITRAAEPFRFPEARDGKAELKYVNGVPVLTVGGTPEEIGRAVGALAVKPGARVLEYPRDLLKIFSAERFMDWFVKGGNGMFRQFPAEYQKELEAMVRSAGVAREPVILGNTFFDLKKVVACSAVLVQAPRSSTGGPLLARNLDYPSLGYIHQYSLVTVYRPAGKHAFASIGFPGLVGSLSGMNDAGLALGVLEVFDVKAGEPSFNAKGVPYALCLRKVLEECTTIDEAQKLLQRLPRTTTINLAIADRDHVAAFEITPAHVVRRDASDNACVCTNHFCALALKPDDPVDVNASFERFASLEKVREAAGKVTPDDLRKHLHTTNMGDLTLQTMVFEPAALKLHLCVGPRPATLGPLRTLDLAPLLKGK